MGADPEILDASTGDVAELRADLADQRLMAAEFDRRHRVRVARVWTVEAPGQADFVRAQLGVGTWANGTVALCGWGNLRRGRTHRLRNPWTPAQLEAANDRNGPGRPGDAPMGALARAREVEKAVSAAGTSPGAAGVPSSVVTGGPCQPGDAAAGASGGYGGTLGAGGPCRARPGAWVVVPPCQHDSPLGPAALASCAGCQAHRLAALANGAEPTIIRDQKDVLSISTPPTKNIIFQKQGFVYTGPFYDENSYLIKGLISYELL